MTLKSRDCLYGYVLSWTKYQKTVRLSADHQHSVGLSNAAERERECVANEGARVSLLQVQWSARVLPL